MFPFIPFWSTFFIPLDVMTKNVLQKGINGNIANKIPYRGHDIQRSKECAPKGKEFSLKLIHHYHLFALKKHLQHLQHLQHLHWYVNLFL
jgi:hypothetical protein